MATLILNSNVDCVISLNGVFQGALYNNKELSLPLLNGETILSASAFEEGFFPIVSHIDADPFRLKNGSAHLYKWNEDIYLLELVFKKPFSSVPPIILKEQPWANGFLGLCGNYLIFEQQNGNRIYFPEPIIDFEPFNNSCVLAKTLTHIIPLNKNLAPLCAPLPCREYSLQDKTLHTIFSPGDMDFFEVHQRYSESLSLIKSEITPCTCNSTFDHLRLFCQAVRLNIKDLALNYLTPSLKEEMNFESIKTFLGVFDQTDKPKYLSAYRENTVALRYKLDDRNFHYICYEFNMVTTTGAPLIDDISEL